MFIHSEIWAEEEMNGEERVDGNKRKRETLIPVDRELKKSLIDWLSIRPDTKSPAHPVFTTKTTRNKEYKRLRGANLHRYAIGEYAQKAGLASPGQDSSDVDLHYFRHFFVTQMAKNRGDHDGGLDPMLIKYIRGDVLDDAILDIYTHDSWGVNVREEYLNNIYNFGIYE
jgi:integrase